MARGFIWCCDRYFVTLLVETRKDMAGIKSLAKDTAIYGISSIVGRFLNWCLVPLYTNVFASDQYGMVTFIYSIVALLYIVLT